MIGLPASVRIYLFCAPVDMRNGHDGLSGVVTRNGQDVFSGHLFVFLSKRRDRVKILAWENGGFVLWYKRIEVGRFKVPLVTSDQETMNLDSAQLSMLLDGIDFSRVRRGKKWRPPRKNATRSDRVVDCRGSTIDKYMDV